VVSLGTGDAPSKKIRRGHSQISFVKGDPARTKTGMCDMLFIGRADRRPLAGYVWSLLSLHSSKVQRWIVFAGTTIFAERDRSGGPGILTVLRYWMRRNPEWSVIYHSSISCGLTILSRRPEDKPPLPSLSTMVWNYTKAVSKHLATGRKVAEPATIETRLQVCAICPFRNENRCALCGCYLDVGPHGREGKAVWLDSVCSIGKW
jgi:hypothetical protein